MKRLTSTILILVIILTSLLTASCASSNTTSTKQSEVEYFISSGKIIVGNTTGSSEGFDLELLKLAINKIASDEKAAIAVEVKEASKEDALTLLKSKTVDVIIGLEVEETAPEGVKYTVKYTDGKAFTVREEQKSEESEESEKPDLAAKLNTALKDLYKAGSLNSLADNYDNAEDLKNQLKTALGE